MRDQSSNWKNIRLALLCAIVSSPICSSTFAQDVVSTSADLSKLHDFFHEPFEVPLDYSMVFANAKARVLDRFGTPVSQTTSRYPARTSDELLWETTLDYDGLVIMVGESEDQARSWLESIEITDRELALRFGLRIGGSRTELLEIFSDSRHLEFDEKLRFDTEIYETRTDTEYRPGEPVTVGTAMALTVTLDSFGWITRFLIESIEL